MTAVSVFHYLSLSRTRLDSRHPELDSRHPELHSCHPELDSGSVRTVVSPASERDRFSIPAWGIGYLAGRGYERILNQVQDGHMCQECGVLVADLQFGPNVGCGCDQ